MVQLNGKVAIVTGGAKRDWKSNYSSVSTRGR